MFGWVWLVCLIVIVGWSWVELRRGQVRKMRRCGAAPRWLGAGLGLRHIVMIETISNPVYWIFAHCTCLMTLGLLERRK